MYILKSFVLMITQNFTQFNDNSQSLHSIFILQLTNLTCAAAMVLVRQFRKDGSKIHTRRIPYRVKRYQPGYALVFLQLLLQSVLGAEVQHILRPGVGWLWQEKSHQNEKHEVDHAQPDIVVEPQAQVRYLGVHEAGRKIVNHRHAARFSRPDHDHDQ